MRDLALQRERRTTASQLLLLNEDLRYDNANNGVCPERFCKQGIEGPQEHLFVDKSMKD